MTTIIKPEPVPMPAAGESYQDPAYGFTVKRISDAVAHGVGWITQEYSTVSPFNCDGTRLLLVHQDHFQLYEPRYGDNARPIYDIAADTEPRWSKDDSKNYYVRKGNRLLDSWGYVIAEFPQFSTISGLGESDIGFDGRTLALCAKEETTLFLYDVIDRRITAEWFPLLDADGLYLTPDGNLVVVFRGAHGIKLFDGKLNFLHQLAPVNSHQDVCRDAPGDECLVMANSPRKDALEGCTNGIELIRLADARRTCLLGGLSWDIALHVSCPDSGNSCFVSTYQRPDAPWRPFSGEVLKVALDGSGVERICHHRSVQTGSYNAQPKVSCSRDGSRLVFASNFGQVDRGPDYCDTYMIELGVGRVESSGRRDAELVASVPVPMPGKWRRIPRKES